MDWVPFLLVLILVSNICGHHEDDEDVNISLIELEALTLPVQSYHHDPFWFYQHIDSRNKITTYHWPKGRKLGSPVFTRNSDDQGEDIIVLRRGEDRLRPTPIKRTFVVLIQDRLNHRIYRPVVAYTR